MVGDRTADPQSGGPRRPVFSRSTWRTFPAIVTALAMFLLAVPSGTTHVSGPFAWGPVVAAGAEPVSDLQAAIALEQLLVDAIADAQRSVVAVARVRRTEKPGEDPAAHGPLAIPQLFADGNSPGHPEFVPNEFGAGVAVSTDGLILTTAHLLGDFESSDYYVWMQHRPFKATLVAADPWYDLAVLKIDADDLVPIAFRDHQPLKKGQIVIALGNPFSIARDGEVSASWGIISNLGRRPANIERPAGETTSRATLHHYGTLLQTDARLHIGYSGGALINLQGKLIGLTTSHAAGSGFDTAAGLAIPIDDNFRRVVDQLKQGLKPDYGFLGVEAEQLAEDVRRKGRHGALVRRVLLGTPAEQAGLRVGDLITQIDGQPLHATDDMIRLIASKSPSSTAVLTVARDFQPGRQDKETKLSATLTKRYLQSARPQYGTAPEPEWRGMRVDFSTASPDFAFLGPLFDPANSVYVADVVKDSAAWDAGVRSGAYVTRIAGQTVASPADFYKVVAGIDGEAGLELRSKQGTTLVRTVSP